jgi:hypothetical protein
MNLKEFRRKRYCPDVYPEVQRTTTKTLTIVGAPAAIRTKYLANTSPKVTATLTRSRGIVCIEEELERFAEDDTFCRGICHKLTAERSVCQPRKKEISVCVGILKWV